MWLELSVGTSQNFSKCLLSQTIRQSGGLSMSAGPEMGSLGFEN